MLKKLVVCLFVVHSLALPESPAWKENTEYTYDVRGRSLSSLKISDEYNGILLRAKLVVQLHNDVKLRCKIVKPEYAEVQTRLPEGWMTDVKADYQPLEISEKPFDLILKNGVIDDLVMGQEVQQWEANIIKSIVSQLQLDTRAENVKSSEYNILPKEGSNNAVFKTVEDTVTGITETTYDIHPMPEYMLQSKPYLAPYPHLKGDGSIIEIIKNKNFTEGTDLPSYYFRFGKAGHFEPQSNQMGQLLHRNSMGRTVITGTLQRYTIQYSETINEVKMSIRGNQRGSVNSMMSLKLVNAEQHSSQFEEISNPVNVGSLVYSYAKQANGNRVSRGPFISSSESQKGFFDGLFDSDEKPTNSHKRHPRSLGGLFDFLDSDEKSVESQEHWTQPKSQLSDAPEFPLLAYFVGNKGQSIKKSSKVRIVEDVITMTQDIGKDIEYPQELPKRQTLSKFVVLTAVLRTMSEDELKQVAQRLYTTETQGPRYNAWVAFRDSVAETGTGPAFMVIKFFIESKKIQGNEAAMVITSMSESVRIPSEEYMKAYFNMVKEHINNPQEYHTLNETMLFTFSRLIHKVYVNSKFSHREYPTHSFGRFDTKSGKSFVREEVIPYFTKELRTAVTAGDSQKIYAYIHALGEIGHPEILNSFQPYLEGKVPCSQFQRLLMVLSLHRVSTVKPELTREVLYRLYQNIGEVTEIRVAAVYMLMYTSPPAEMLQRIAKYTEIESNHKVCAAVKSAILSSSRLEGSDFAELRSAAESASHFLTKKNFGVQDSQEYSYSQAYHSWESYYRHVLQTIASEESGIPSSFYYGFASKGNGLKYNTFSLNSMVSDIRNLFHVLQKQTTWYDQLKQQQTSSQQSESSTWTSYNVARLLNFQSPELEQLEGGLFVHLGEIRRHFIYNNHSIERLPQILEEALRTLENGKKIKYTTLINNGDSAVAFPTEIGVPFIVAHDYPILVNVEGTVKVSSEPKIVSGDKLSIPDKVQMESDLKVTISVKQRDEFGFFAPFNRHQYSAGYDKNYQVYLPIRAKITVDVNKKNVEYEVEPLESEEKVKLFHLSSWPHITKYDILDVKATVDKTSHLIRRPLQKKLDLVVGDKTVGMGFRVKYENDDSHTNIQSLFKGLYEDRTQYEYLDVEYVPEYSKNKRVKGSFTYMKEEQKEYQAVDRKTILSSLFKLPSDDKTRVAQLMKYAPFGVTNAEVFAVDAKVQFVGNQNVDYVASLAYARTEENSKARMLAYVNKESRISGSKPLKFAVCGQFDNARYSGFDMNYIMNNDLSSHAYVDVAFGEKVSSDNQIEFHAVLKRSDARKAYLMEQPSYHKCYSEMQQGNNQLLSCVNITQMAGLLDHVDFEMKYHNMHSKDLHNIKSFTQRYIDHITIDTRQSKLRQGEFKGKVRFSSDLQYVNASMTSKDVQVSLKNFELNDWAQRVFVIHPVFDVMDRVAGKFSGRQTYKPICTMDKSEAYSFDGSEYPLALNNYWTVIMQYIPMRSYGDSKSTVEELLKEELENYVVLARQSSQGSSKKEVKIVVSTPTTKGKIVEITMKPSSGYPQVFVDKQQITVKQNGDSESYKDQVTILGLPNGAIFVKVHNAFNVIYDGTRVRITALTMNLRNRVRGLCGTFDGQKSDDFTTPSNCVVRDPQEFIASYTVLKDGEHNSQIMDLKSRSQKNHCSYKKVPLYVNYIRGEEKTGSSVGSCTKYQTRYVVENGQICFTIRPQTVCKSHCRQHGTNYKNIEVHCVQNRNVATLWKNQIDNGASPDFSLKAVTKSVQLEVPQTCRSS